MRFVIRCLCESVKQERCYVEACTVRVKEGSCNIQASAVSKEQSNWLNGSCIQEGPGVVEEGIRDLPSTAWGDCPYINRVGPAIGDGPNGASCVPLAFAGEPVCVFVLVFVFALRGKKSNPERQFFRFGIKK